MNAELLLRVVGAFFLLAVAGLAGSVAHSVWKRYR